ncbi:DNA-directed RNA polymerase III subunit RPC6 [Clonorchis sinensis]|uniref:DNA-directed RNA polymerase III subunit RPC6 n=1 Tax=Clonorchis sinensis TaxID=79923 RepID=A0A8T1MII1_CLOSI|nr:DNA-directed RNA polymerase III subunit RPC6 [Clonorchis sinensis]
MKLEGNSLRDRVLNLFTSTGGALTQKHFEKEFSDVSLTTILPVLNALQKEGLLDVLVNADRTLSWKLRDQSNIDTIKSLTDLEERLVYNAIRKAGEDAASVKSISTDTKLQQTRIPRILKSLIAKKLIKELPMSTGQKQKVYLLIDLQPSEKLAANTLFAGESGVDGEFVAILRTACLKYLQDKTNIAANIADPLERRNASYVSVEEIHRFISNARICNVTMTLQDVQCVLDALKYGGELESRITSEIDRNISASSGSPSPMRTMYRLAPQTASTAGLAHLPCTVCMCRKDCRPGGSISPENCKLFNAFLDF